MGKLSQYEVRLASLPEGKYEQDFVCDSSLFRMMDNDEVSSADVNVHLTVERRHGSYELTFDCRGTMTVACDRCLDDLSVPVDTIYRMRVRYGEQYDDTGEDLLILPERQTTLDVAPIIYTTLMLCIPLHKVHAAGECNPEMLARLGEYSTGPVDDDSDDDGADNGPD